jgi:uncharacterized DUF497 family protein
MVREDGIFHWEGFDWDEGNLFKNWEKHGVTALECEQIFFNNPLLTEKNRNRSEKEYRYYALGITDAKRRLFIAFTIRQNRIRVISARNMSRGERKAFDRL